MVEYLMIVLPMVLSLLAYAVTSTAPDVGGDQFGCENSKHCYPFIALLVNLDAMCSAAIVSTRWMVSSANCYTKSGRGTFLAYAGSSDLTAAESLQVRCAYAAVWADPISGAMAPEASERSQVMLLLTSAPWTVAEAVHPVAIGELPLSPSALQESRCITAGFDLKKTLAVASCEADVHLDEAGHVCFNSFSRSSVPAAPGALLYCYGFHVLIGVGLGDRDLLSNNMDNMDDSPSFLESCFTYLGGTLLKRLQHIADNNFVTDDNQMNSMTKIKTSRSHRKEANHMATFITANRTANRFDTISNLNDAAVSEDHEVVGKYTKLEKRDFNGGLNRNEMVLDYKRSLTTTPIYIMWALILVPVVVGYMVISCWARARKLVRRLYRSARWKRSSHNYECT